MVTADDDASRLELLTAHLLQVSAQSLGRLARKIRAGDGWIKKVGEVQTGHTIPSLRKIHG